MRVLAKIVIILVGIVAVFYLTGFLSNILPPDLPPWVLLITRLGILVLSAWIIMQVAGRIEEKLDRKSSTKD